MEKEEVISLLFHNAIKNSGKDLSSKLQGLSKGEAGVLGYLAFIENNVNAGVLSYNLKISSARVAKLLNTLERKKYITRHKCEEDKRKIIVCISEKGKKLAQELKKEIFDMLSYVIDEIGIQEFITYVNTLGKISKIIERKEGNTCYK